MQTLLARFEVFRRRLEVEEVHALIFAGVHTHSRLQYTDFILLGGQFTLLFLT